VDLHAPVAAADREVRVNPDEHDGENRAEAGDELQRSASSSAPPRGNCSAVTPSIVGQKNVLPTPKTVAAANATIGLAPGCRLPSQ
jgi:hypothetical protein